MYHKNILVRKLVLTLVLMAFSHFRQIKHVLYANLLVKVVVMLIPVIHACMDTSSTEELRLINV